MSRENDLRLRAIGMPPCPVCGVCMVEEASGSVELDGKRWRCLNTAMHQAGKPETYVIEATIELPPRRWRSGTITFNASDL